MTNRKPMGSISYGLNTPQDLLSKLERDKAKLFEKSHTEDSYADEIFNFFITANSLKDWIFGTYGASSPAGQKALRLGVFELNKGRRQPELSLSFPHCVTDWIDHSRLPGKVGGQAAQLHLKNIFELIRHVANASKHYFWSNEVTQIETDPEPENWYQFFTWEPNLGLCVDIDTYRYSVGQISFTVTQYYSSLLLNLDEWSKEQEFNGP